MEDTPEMNPQAEAMETQDESTAVERETSLEEREQAIALRERQFLAREHLIALNLPREVLELVDCSTDRALDASLRLASAVYQAAAAAAPPVSAPPLAASPAPPRFATYVDRAKLYQEDKAAYQEMVQNP